MKKKSRFYRGLLTAAVCVLLVPSLVFAEEPAAESEVPQTAAVESTAASAPAEDLLACLKGAAKAMEPINSESFQADIAVTSSMMQGNMSLQAKGKVKPEVALEGVMNTTFGSVLTNQNKFSTPFYMVQDGQDIISYVNTKEDKWEKRILKNYLHMLNPAIKEKAAASASEMFSAVTQVSLLQELPASRELQVTVDMTRLSEQLAQQMKQSSLKPEEAAQFEKAQQFMKAMGEVQAKVTIDRSNSYIIRVDSDLTEPCRRLAQSVLLENNKGKAADQLLISQLIQNSTIQFSLTQGDFNTAAAAVVPAEIQKKAVLQKDEKSSKTKK